MNQQPSKREMELAQARIEELKNEFRQKRARCVATAISLVVAAAVLFLLKLPMLAFCALMIAFISLLLYFDANGQLHIIGLRSTKTLYPRMSILKGHKPDKVTGDST
jgi:hypothetical protein